MLQRSEQTRGELIGVAHILRAIEFRLRVCDEATEVGLQQVRSDCVSELERLIGNQFQMRTDIGNPVQLAKVILLMAGEESE